MSLKKIVKYYTQKGYLRRQLKFACEAFVISQISSDCRISNWRSYAFMYVKEVFSMYLSLDLIMKAEEPMVFYDHLIFFSGFLQTATILPEWLCTNKNRNKQKNRHYDHLFSIVKSYCLCCCEVLRPQLFFDFTLGLEKKKVSESVNVVILWCWLPTSC